MLVSFFSGVVKSTPGYDKMRKLPSFAALQTGITIGSKVELTVDLFTAVGVLILVNKDKGQMDKDLAAVRKLQEEGLFTYDEEIDPCQFEVSPDLITPAGHRSRGASMDSNIEGIARRRRADSVASSRNRLGSAYSAGSHRISPEKSQTNVFGMVATAFAAGALVGIALGRR